MAHTNSTTHYEYPQFIGTDKPGWLTDVNTAYSDIDTDIYTAQTKADSAYTLADTAEGKADNAQLTANTAVTNAGTANTNIGTMANLTTTEKSSLVGAINEVDSDIGDLTNLDTETKTNLVSAINEVNDEYNGTVLYQTAYPSDGVQTQNITLSSDDYDLLEIWYAGFYNDNDTEVAYAVKNKGFRLTSFLSGGGVRVRSFTFTDSTHLVGNAGNSDSIGNNIVYKIIGHKREHIS